MISVIVPTYNRETLLSYCIDSILSQSYFSFELLIIDDGSTDKTEKLVSLYLKKDERIKYYKQKHSGVSCARNYGLSVAKGDYIVFVDSDDSISEHYLENLYNGITKEKSFMSVIWKLDNGCDINKLHKDDSEFSISKDIFCQYSTDNWINPIGGKIFNRRLISDKGILFNRNLSYGEDTAFIFEYLLYMDNSDLIYLTNANEYVVNEGSGSRLSDVHESEKYQYILYISQKIQEAFEQMRINEYQNKLLEQWVYAKTILFDIRKICLSNKSFLYKYLKVKKIVQQNDKTLRNCSKTLYYKSKIKYIVDHRNALLMVLYYCLKDS